MLTVQDIEEELSYAYLHAVASKAGLAVQRVTRDKGIDVQVLAEGRLSKKAKWASPRIDVQLKACCTVKVSHTAATFSYDLKRKNYDDLRLPTAVPRILVLLVLPSQRKLWVSHSEKHLISRDCAYWVNLRNEPSTTNRATKRIVVPRSNTVTPTSLKRLLRRAGEQGHL